MATKTEKERTTAIREFCAVVGSDNEAFASSALQEVDFNLEEAVVRYFSALDSGPLPDFVLNDDANGNLRKRPHSDVNDADSKRSKLNSTSNSFISSSGASSSNKQPRITDIFTLGPSTSKEQDISATSNDATDRASLLDIPQQITIMSYNIDGCDDRIIQKRVSAILEIISRVNPDVILFQGVTIRQDPFLRSFLNPLYKIYQGHNNFAYYTLTAVGRHINVERTEIVEFERTRMGRNLLVVEGKWNDLNLKIINTHLESCWQGTQDRKRQFFTVMGKMHEWASDPNVFMLFGGDLNLRDPESSNIPEGVKDAWILAGSDTENKYTWDTKLNSNKKTKTVCRSRYDRFFVRCPHQKLKFWLEGKEPVEGEIFPSDHFAIVCRFTMPKLV